VHKVCSRRCNPNGVIVVVSWAQTRVTDIALCPGGDVPAQVGEVPCLCKQPMSSLLPPNNMRHMRSMQSTQQQIAGELQAAHTFMHSYQPTYALM